MTKKAKAGGLCQRGSGGGGKRQKVEKQKFWRCTGNRRMKKGGEGQLCER